MKKASNMMVPPHLATRIKQLPIKEHETELWFKGSGLDYKDLIKHLGSNGW